MMRILICGSRGYKYTRRLMDFVDTLTPDTEIIVGDARGVDRIVKAYAISLGFDPQVFEAAWDRYGRNAGMRRNLEMLDQMPHLVIAFWDGSSPGTKMMIETALKRHINIQVVFDLGVL